MTYPDVMRTATFECNKCGAYGKFTVFAGEGEDSDLNLDLMIQQEHWTSVCGDDYCPECSGES